MTISIRLPAADDALLERSASALRLSKSEFIRRSIAAYAQKMLSSEQTRAEIDARYIGQGGGLRNPESVADPHRRAIVARLREKYGDAGRHRFPGRPVQRRRFPPR
ncbi:MAG: ribbon-helix-helix protein, CopG family [Desulfobulbus sp.]|nr:ribbon-helix-helix protein, CopG family [Desulfobulbus sp.]